MILTLFDYGKVFNVKLPERITGRYMIPTEVGGKMTDLIAVEEENGQWYIKSNKRAFLKNKNGDVAVKALVEAFKTYTLYKQEGGTALLYVEPHTMDRYEFVKYEVVTSEMKIGRTKNCDVCFPNNLVSSSHCIITYKNNGEAVIQDTNSSNGTFVNGERITEKKLAVGDVIYVMGLRIIFNGKMVSINNPHNLVQLNNRAVRLYEMEEPIVKEADLLDDFTNEEEGQDFFYRSPRFKRDIDKKEIKIDSPPQKQNLDETPLALILGPSITMGMSSLFMAVFTVQNVMRNDGDIMNAIPTLVMSFGMLLGTILWPILTKRYEKKRNMKQEKIRLEKYRQYLVDMEKVIAEECQHQSEILHENHVPLSDYITRIKTADVKLWERVIGQNDFLKVRLGLGNTPLHAKLNYPEKRFMLDDDPLYDELYQLMETPKVLKEVPITLSLIEEKVSGFIGKRQYVAGVIKGFIFQLAALHSYDEVKMVFLYDESEKELWDFVKWIPHTWSDEKDIRFIATKQSDVKELASYFEKEIYNRKALLESNGAELHNHYLIFSMSKQLAAKAEMLNVILAEKRDLGFSVITLYDELKNLPKECSAVVELTESYSKIYDKDDTTGTYTAFKSDIFLQENAEMLAIKLANIYLYQANNMNELPNMLTFLEMFGVSKIEHLNALTRWKENDPTVTIETPIGVNTTGELFKIDLHEKYHGPHGLIAGMTGSGKSEFIMTFILSLAVNYHPDEVAFILIDYKGGGMANAFLNLPHLAGTITNLDGAAVKRSLISIQSELKRRQAVFGEAGKQINESNIDIYKYQKLYREGRVREPLQHLFIISDEFAELKTQQPEFMEQLVSAARIGRSLGVHLILATQKPSGVVDDQIWSNSKFRICLKVQEKADSMDVIKRPDAAELKTTGRFYLQVGFNEVFDIGQSAWGGAAYYPSDKAEKNIENSVTFIDNLGRILKYVRSSNQNTQVKNPPKQIDAITNYLATLAREEEIKVRPLWLEPIPEIIYVDELKVKYTSKQDSSTILNPVIGEYDDPATQAQRLLTLPISSEGNTIVYGVAGSGKTTFLTTMIYSLMKEHTPEEMNVYILDFASETLRSFSSAPHVGDVLLSYESEKINNLFKMMHKEIEDRKQLFSDYGGDIASYIRTTGQVVPAIVIVIHNFSSFIETYENQEDEIAYLTREGTKYGIYFIVTALNTNAVRYRLLQNFKQLFVLQLNDDSDYAGVLGNIDGVYPSKFKGRGIFKQDTTYEFQVAHAIKTEDTLGAIRTYCQSYADSWTKMAAKRIPVLPAKLDMNYLAEELTYSQNMKVPVGIEKETLNLCHYDFDAAFISLVMSQDNDNASFSQGLAEVITKKYNREVIVIDSDQAFINDWGKAYRYISEDSQLNPTIVELFNTLVTRNNTIKDARENGEAIPDYHKMTVIIHSYSHLYNKLSDDSKEKMNIFFEKCEVSYGVNFILVDSVSNISNLSYETWFKNQVSLSNGIWIGSGISNQYQFKVSKITRDMYEEVEEGFGYVLIKGKTKLVKLLSSSKDEMESVEMVEV